jgi:hypothetical protein
MTNLEITSNLENLLKNAFETFKNSTPSSEEITAFKELTEFDFDTYKKGLKEQIKNRFNEVWTNTEKGIDPNQKLDGFLLEYFAPSQPFTEAIGYGIINWKEKDIDTAAVDMGWDYDFAEGLEQTDGITLSYFNPFTNIQVIDPENDSRIKECFKFKGLAIINHVFNELNEEGLFDKMSINKEFYFLVGEHDEGCHAVLKV